MLYKMLLLTPFICNHFASHPQLTHIRMALSFSYFSQLVLLYTP